MGLQGVTGGNKGLQWIKRGYRVLQGVKGGYKRVIRGYKRFDWFTGGQKLNKRLSGLHKVTGNNMGLQGVTRA